MDYSCKSFRYCPWMQGQKPQSLGKTAFFRQGCRVEGSFDRGDVVKLECEGRVFAKGITDYTSEELIKVKGAHNDEIEVFWL